MERECVLFIGVQGAGKSTFYRERFFGTHLRLNLDMLNKSRWKEAILLQAFLQTGQPFVVDNTNPTAEVRKKYIDAARQARFKVIGYYFDVDFDDAMVRNGQRVGKACVPEVALKSVLKIMQPPTHAEGFDEIYRVQVIDGSFVVEPLAPA